MSRQITDEEADKLRIRLSNASNKLGQLPYKMGQGAENEYTRAYVELARGGRVYRLKRKYTGGVA